MRENGVVFFPPPPAVIDTIGARRLVVVPGEEASGGNVGRVIQAPPPERAICPRVYRQRESERREEEPGTGPNIQGPPDQGAGVSRNN